jgi:hypothetical protein
VRNVQIWLGIGALVKHLRTEIRVSRGRGNVAVVLWAVVWFQRLSGTSCLHFTSALNLEAMRSTETLTTTRWRHNPENHSKALLSCLKAVRELAVRIMDSDLFLRVETSDLESDNVINETRTHAQKLISFRETDSR